MIIYMITNKSNNKVYIGKTKYTSKIRFKKHIRNCFIDQRQSKLYTAFRKYGINSFQIIDICCVLDEKHLSDIEILLINEYNSNNHDYGYNMTTGGDGGVMSNISIAKMIATRLNNGGWNLSDDHKQALIKGRKATGYNVTEEQKIKISNTLKHKWKTDSDFREKMTNINRTKAKSGSDHPMYGMNHGESAKIKISEAKKGKSWDDIYGKDVADALKKDMSNRMSGTNNPFYKHINDFDIINTLVKTPRITTKELSDFFGVSRPTIAKRIQNLYNIDNIQSLRYNMTDNELVEFFRNPPKFNK